MNLSPIFAEGLSWILWAAAGVVVLAAIWAVVQFVFKLTLKIFTLGCLGILLAGLLCAAAAYFGSGNG